MENASQALIIAGGILIAIVIITLGVYVYGGLHSVAQEQDLKAETDQLIAFNKKYEAYKKSLMHGTDVITVLNMAEQDKETYGYEIDVKFQLLVTDTYVYSGSGSRTASGSFSGGFQDYDYYEKNIKYVKGNPKYEGNKDRFDDFKRRLFKGGIEYDKTTGRVNKMVFTEEKLTTDQYIHK